jgi:hypothetical protein
MRTLGHAWLAVLLLATASIAAETSYSCNPGVLSRLKIVPSSGQMFRGRFIQPAMDPVANGLTIEAYQEPETDPANLVFSVTLPASGFVATSNGARYRDPNGAIGSVTSVRITTKGAGRFTIRRSNGASSAGLTSGAVRIVLGDGTAFCVRTCAAPCTQAGGSSTCRDRHRLSVDSLCGLRSGCEVLNGIPAGIGGHCLLPYPSSFFEAADGSTPTGKRIAYPRLAMPRNGSGVHIDPAAWATLDGFSPGTMIATNFTKGVDLAASGVPPFTDYGASLAPGSPTVLIEADSPGCQRIEHFGENDVSLDPANVPVARPNQLFLVRPGRRLKNATRYIVALRGLVDQDGGAIATPAAFKALRDGTPSGLPALEARRPAFESILTKLTTDCGVDRSSLVLAWDFTTASDESLESILLSMRDQTFALLGSAAPAFTVNTVEDDPFGDPRVCRRVQGTYQVPLFMTADAPGALLNLDTNGVPVQNGFATAPFTAIIPCSLVNPTPSSGRPIFYGHGLLGSGFNDVSNADHLRQLANDHRFVVAGTDWQGMSSADLPTIFAFINDFTNFRKLPERLHQGVLNQLVLARLLGAPSGLSSHPAFIYGGTPVIDPSAVFYYGNSQGGILGGTVMALSQETTRGVLGVPAANFSILLQRSVDFAPYFTLLKAAYPNDVERMLTYPIIQQLWDRSEPNGWYHHTLANPLPGTPAHKILVHMATSDAEVTNLACQIMVRTMGIPQVSPVVSSYFGIPEQAAPFDGSAMIESDGSFGPVPLTNVPPANNGAHAAMRTRPAIQAQIDRFLRTGGDVENFCAGPCDPE